MAPKFEIHLENFNHALHISNGGHQSDIWCLDYLLFIHGIKPYVYILKDWLDENPNHYITKEYNNKNEKFHIFGSHGVHHYYDEKADRSPYFNQEGYPFPPAGGFFFRLMPLWYLKWAIKKSGVLWLHPYDFDVDHPKLKNPIMNWKRHVGIRGAKAKLERLLKEVKFE